MASSSQNPVQLSSSMSLPKTVTKHTTSKIESLVEYSYIPDSAQVNESSLPLVNPYQLYQRPSRFTRSIRSLISTSRSTPKEYIQSSSLDQCSLQSTSAEQYVTLEIFPELISHWKQQRYTHFHLGGVRLILTLHGRKGLPVTAHIALLDTRFKQYEQATIGTVFTTLHAGSVDADNQRRQAVHTTPPSYFPTEPYHPLGSFFPTTPRDYTPERVFPMTYHLNPQPAKPKPRPPRRPVPPPAVSIPPPVRPMYSNAIQKPLQIHEPVFHDLLSTSALPPFTESPSKAEQKKPAENYLIIAPELDQLNSSSEESSPSDSVETFDSITETSEPNSFSSDDSQQHLTDISRLLMADHAESTTTDPPPREPGQPYVDIPSDVEGENEGDNSNPPPRVRTKVASGNGPWFTFDDLPPARWRERLQELSAWLDLQMVKPDAELSAVLKEFVSRFTGSLRDWFDSLGQYRQLLYLQHPTVSAALMDIHSQFLGEPAAIFATARKEYLQMRCCSMQRSDLHYHFKRIQLLRLQEWFSRYEFDVEHIKGQRNLIPDFLSRIQTPASPIFYTSPVFPVFMATRSTATSLPSKALTQKTFPRPVQTFPSLYRLQEFAKQFLFRYYMKAFFLEENPHNQFLTFHPENLFLTGFFIPSVRDISDDELWYFWCLTVLHATQLIIPLAYTVNTLNNPSKATSLLWTLLEWFSPIPQWRSQLQQLSHNHHLSTIPSHEAEKFTSVFIVHQPYFRHPETAAFFAQPQISHYHTTPHPNTLDQDPMFKKALMNHLMSLNHIPPPPQDIISSSIGPRHEMFMVPNPSGSSKGIIIKEERPNTPPQIYYQDSQDPEDDFLPLNQLLQEFQTPPQQEQGQSSRARSGIIEKFEKFKKQMKITSYEGC
ncbi:hypothetical protein KPL71_014574 [Citrus sinensis]|uniref:Uncharacterized protein n=1 Tax=Citrus sinensis TaxID=2711 RepID=A0ACB8KCP0_CITSI|nr:hypothetical protein KPL71_014574 [Citrus sinensis]